MAVQNQPKFVVIGGGTGSFTLLSALKHYVQDITALVSMADDGGSTGMLRDEYGVLPPGDVRQCLVALSNSPHLRELFTFRFPGENGLGGHNFGNLFISALEMTSKNYAEAIQTASEVLRIQGKVVPISLDDCRLVYKNPEGKVIKGESNIEMTDFSEDSKPMIAYEKPVRLNNEARKSLENADIVIIAPGSLYTSLIPLLLVSGMPELLQTIRAKIVYVANLVNKPGETDDFCISDYVHELERYAGEQVIDAVLYNTDVPEPKVLKKYQKEHEELVKINTKKMKDATFTAIPGSFLAKEPTAPDTNDPLRTKRSLIRHDGDAVARALMKLYYS